MRSGLLAEFESSEALLAAAERLRALGFSDLDAFTPFQLPELERALGVRRSRIPAWVLGAALLGVAFAYIFQWWIAAVDYPVDVGGRPLHSGPAFIPITFETAVLFGSLTAFVALLAYCGLPRLWHPVFEVEGFERATIDRFWLGVDARDPRFGEHGPKDVLEQMGALRVAEVGR